MDNIILGLLLLSKRTIYQLHERIEKGINLMYSSSIGSIQAGIKKLLSAGYIDVEEVFEDGKLKKFYFITQKGQDYFFGWINEPLKEQTPRNPELIKLYFMGFANKGNQRKSIEKHIEFLKTKYSLLCSICNDSNSLVVPDDKKGIFEFQLASAIYGRDLLKFNIDWFENLLTKI